MSDYYAHISPDGRTQAVDAHLRGTASLAETFCRAFDSAPYGNLAGMTHDVGKNTAAFQHRLAGGPKVDHSTAGALLCAAIGQPLAAICVVGHHGGLPDFGNMQTDQPGDPTLVGRLKKKIQDIQAERDPSDRKNLPPHTPPEPTFNDGFYRSLWTRMLYSALVDADYLDTEAFMQNGAVCRGGYDTLKTLLNKLTDYLARWSKPTNALNRIRNTILQDCIKAAEQKPGLFSLTVPTGGGKTIASLAFALHHAVQYGMDRVIYVIPYTSIIEQNAAVFRSILGDENVVEHHSEADIREDSEERSPQALATENWDAPVIVTTAVQFFDSLYANKPSKCRKLHNIANSVVIFDEAQMLPTCHLLPCTAAIGTLVAHFRVSTLLCTATQPQLSDLLDRFTNGAETREICPDVPKLFNALRRVSYRRIGAEDAESLASKLASHAQVLCIVNTRKAARDVFERLPEEGRFHLSTLMYPKHRQSVLATIRERLERGEVCRVVSTSLIEAGVDVDFPAVYRQLSGLDSVVQAAGRCNREGRHSAVESVVTVFELDDRVPPLMRVNIGAAREAMQSGADVGDPATIRKYFSAYRSLMGDGIDKTNAVAHLCDGIAGCNLPFKTVAEAFRMIDSETKTVYIPCAESEALIRRLTDGTADRRTYRLAGRFAVQIYTQHYNALLSSGDIFEFGSGQACLANTDLYHESTGLSLESDSGKALFI